MLVAPSCSNVYLSPQQSQQNKNSNASSSASKNSGSSASNNSSIFKRTMNFISKFTGSSGSPSTSTSVSTSSKPAGSENNESSSSETPSDCSSPDSLKIELEQFKPIIREPRTPSSASSKVVRVPPVRSVSISTDFIIRSPCPSPFVPITPLHMSAFSLVRETGYKKPVTLAKPEATKRKQPGPIQPPAKKIRKDVIVTQKSPEKTRNAGKKVAAKPKEQTKTDVVKRTTRSMDLKEAKDVDCPKPAPGKKKVQEQKVFQAPAPAKKASPKKRGQAPAAAKTAPAPAQRSLRTRH